MVHGAVLQNMVMKCNKIRFHTCQGKSFVLTKPHVCLFSSFMLLLWAAWKAQGDFEEVGTSNTSHSTHTIEVTLLSHVALTLPMCVNLYQCLHSYWEYQDSHSKHIYIIGQYFDKYRYKPGLEPTAQSAQGFKPRPAHHYLQEVCNKNILYTPLNFGNKAS